MIRDYQAIGRTWFPKGQQKKIPTYGKHWGDKLLGTLDYETWEVLCEHAEHYTAVEFWDLLKTVVARYAGEKIMMVLDNAAVHHAKLIQPFLEEHRKTSVVNYYAKVFSDAKVSARPTAIFCYNDEIAVGLIKQWHQHNLSVPEYVSVLGYSDSEMANVVPHGLTTMTHPKIEWVGPPQLVVRATVIYPTSVRDLVKAA